METGNVRIVVVVMVLTTLLKVSSPLCTPLNTKWISYKPTLPPMAFEGTSTTGGCSGLNCVGPAFTSLTPSTLGDGEHGTTTLNVNAAHAWNNSVSIQFNFPNSVDVSGINLYFYNIPSMNIALPYNTVLSLVSSTIEGNQDLSQDDIQLRNVTLIPTQQLTGNEFTIQFTFSDTDKIDWLLLTEVEICTSGGIPIPNPATITFTGDTVNSVSPTTVNSTISLSCYVENEGRFTWSWTLSSGRTVSPTFILDTGRTSVLELSQVTSGDISDYTCHVNYTGLASDPGPSTMFTVALSLTGTLERGSDVVYVDENDITATLRCELRGYLPPGEPSINWFKSDTSLTNDSTYTITIETGDGYIQNGGSQTRPSLRSVLKINLMNNPVTTNQTFSCQSHQIAGLRNITLSLSTSQVKVVTNGITSTGNGGTTRSTPDVTGGSILSFEAVGATVGVLLVLIIIIIICVVLILLVFKRRENNSDDSKTSSNVLPGPSPDNSIEMKETVNNNLYNTAKLNSPHFSSSDPETGQSHTPFYDTRDGNHGETSEAQESSKQGDDEFESKPDPLYSVIDDKGKQCSKGNVNNKRQDSKVHKEEESEGFAEHVYSVVQKGKKVPKGHKEDFKDLTEEEPESYPEHLYAAVQKKKKRAQSSKDHEGEELENYPEHVYSLVQKGNSKANQKAFFVNKM